MRIAFFSPLQPVRSGISDYSEELLPFLGKLASVDLVTEGYMPVTPGIADRFQVLNPDQFLRAKDSYDAVIYQIGNNHRCHGYMLPCMAAAPGIVVLHDYTLTYLMLPLTLGSGDHHTLLQILQPTYGDRSRAVSMKILLGLTDPYEIALSRPVIEMSRGVIVHNRFCYNRMQSEYPGRRVQLIPHATPRRELPSDPNALRARYGFSPDDIIVASISTLAYNKRVKLVLRALRRLIQHYPQMKFLVVGAGELGDEARALIREYGLSNCIRQTGWASYEAYLDFIDIADVVVELRYPTAGETSGSTLRAMQAGKPLVVTADGFFLEIPDDCCIRVPVAHGEEDKLVEALFTLLGDRQLRLRLGAAGRQFAHNHLGLEQAAASYLAFAEEMAVQKPGPARTWTIGANPDRGAGGKLLHSAYNSAYKIGRICYYYRHYGLSGTLRRIRANRRYLND